MTKEEHISYWLKGAVDDLKAAETLLHSKQYNWCLFIAHLVLEKTLKAFFIFKNKHTIPPKTHNLVKLAELSLIELSNEKRIFLDEVNSFNLEARYPDYKNDFYKKCSQEFAEDYFFKIKEFHLWLKSQLTSEKQ